MQLLAGEFLLRCAVAVFQQVAELHVLFLAHPGLQGDGFGQLQQGFADQRFAEIQLLGDFSHAGQAA